MNPKQTARLAGALYVASGIPAVFSLIYVPGKLIVSGDAAETARRPWPPRRSSARAWSASSSTR